MTGVWDVGIVTRHPIQCINSKSNMKTNEIANFTASVRRDGEITNHLRAVCLCALKMPSLFVAPHDSKFRRRVDSSGSGMVLFGFCGGTIIVEVTLAIRRLITTFLWLKYNIFQAARPFAPAAGLQYISPFTRIGQHSAESNQFLFHWTLS